MTHAKDQRIAPREAEGVAFEVEPLESVEGVEFAPQAPPGDRPLARLRERLATLEKELDAIEAGYEARLADMARRLAAADARDAERKAVLQDMLAKLQ